MYVCVYRNIFVRIRVCMYFKIKKKKIWSASFSANIACYEISYYTLFVMIDRCYKQYNTGNNFEQKYIEFCLKLSKKNFTFHINLCKKHNFFCNTGLKCDLSKNILFSCAFYIISHYDTAVRIIPSFSNHLCSVS